MDKTYHGNNEHLWGDCVAIFVDHLYVPRNNGILILALQDWCSSNNASSREEAGEYGCESHLVGFYSFFVLDSEIN